jgi:hypothetical protein
MKTPLLSQNSNAQTYSESKNKVCRMIPWIAVFYCLLVSPSAQAYFISGYFIPEHASENLPPVAICISTPLTVYLDENGSVEIKASQLDGGSYDPEQGPVTFLTRKVKYTCADIGPQEVTLVVLDNTGQSDECTTTVFIADNIPPIAHCKNIMVMPDGNGNYSLEPVDINFGSTDNCGIMNMTVTPSFVPCAHESVQQLVTLTVTDSSGNSGTCTSYVQFLGDSDCDGVGDLCDQCPGGNDQIDNNNDGIPDCAVFPGINNIPSDWQCNNKCNQKVLICHIPPGNPENRHTICISINALPAHLAHGDYIGPCDDANCARETRSAETGGQIDIETDDILMYPNPATSQVFLDFTAYEGKEAIITIFNNFGILVYDRKFETLPENRVMISLENYEAGLYHIRINGNDFSKSLKLQVK